MCHLELVNKVTRISGGVHRLIVIGWSDKKNESGQTLHDARHILISTQTQSGSYHNSSISVFKSKMFSITSSSSIVEYLFVWRLRDEIHNEMSQCGRK